MKQILALMVLLLVAFSCDQAGLTDATLDLSSAVEQDQLAENFIQARLADTSAMLAEANIDSEDATTVQAVFESIHEQMRAHHQERRADAKDNRPANREEMKNLWKTAFLADPFDRESLIPPVDNRRAEHREWLISLFPTINELAFLAGTEDGTNLVTLMNERMQAKPSHRGPRPEAGECPRQNTCDQATQRRHHRGPRNGEGPGPRDGNGPGPHHGGHHPGPHGPFMLGFLLNQAADDLELTDDQTTALEALIEEHKNNRPETAPEKQGPIFHQMIVYALTEGEVTEAVLDAFLEEQETRHAERHTAFLDRVEEIHDILTAEQRETLLTLIEANRPPRRER